MVKTPFTKVWSFSEDSVNPYLDGQSMASMNDGNDPLLFSTMLSFLIKSSGRDEKDIAAENGLTRAQLKRYELNEVLPESEAEVKNLLKSLDVYKGEKSREMFEELFDTTIEKWQKEKGYPQAYVDNISLAQMLTKLRMDSDLTIMEASDRSGIEPARLAELEHEGKSNKHELNVLLDTYTPSNAEKIIAGEKWQQENPPKALTAKEYLNRMIIDSGLKVEDIYKQANLAPSLMMKPNDAGIGRMCKLIATLEKALQQNGDENYRLPDEFVETVKAKFFKNHPVDNSADKADDSEYARNRLFDIRKENFDFALEDERSTTTAKPSRGHGK